MVENAKAIGKNEEDMERLAGLVVKVLEYTLGSSLAAQRRVLPTLERKSCGVILLKYRGLFWNDVVEFRIAGKTQEA